MENKNNDKKVINCKFSQIFLEFVALLLVWNDSNSVFLRQLKRNNLKQIRNMKKIRAAVVGYGNIGKFTLEALEAAPDFELKGVDGKTYKLSDFKGKKVYLKFWASWCSICLSTLKDTDELAKNAGKDYVVLTVVSPGHVGEKSEADFKNWYEKLNYKHLPVLLDPSGKLLEQYGVRSYPTAAFIGSDGKLVKTRPGLIKKAEIESTLKSIK